MSADLFAFVVLSVPVLPLVAAAWLGLSMVAGRQPSELVISRLTKATVFYGLLASGWVLAQTLADPQPRVVRAFYWLFVPGHEIDVAFWIDPLAAAMMFMTMAISVVVVWFSVPYLHREDGFQRYFMLINLFIGGMLVLVMGDGFVMLFLGWEWVGVCSALLIAFFHERAGPVRAGARAFYTNRFGDFGLLAASLIAGHFLGGDDWGTMTAAAEGLASGVTTAMGLALLVAAMSKSAQLPFSNWMVHAVEGPTTSTGLFYGAVMAHAGIYLMLRTGPIVVHSDVAMWAMLGVGGATMVYATAVGAKQADTKSALIYSTIAQLGAMFAALGAGAWHLVIVLMILHSGLRAVQFLLAPSIIVRTRAAQHNAALTPGAGRPPLFLHSGLVVVAVVVALWGTLGLSDLPWSDGAPAAQGPIGPYRDWLLTAAAALSAIAIVWAGRKRPGSRLPPGWATRLHDYATHRFFLDQLEHTLVVRPLLRLSTTLRAIDGRLRGSVWTLVVAALVVGGFLAIDSITGAVTSHEVTRFNARETPSPLGLPWLSLLWLTPAATAVLIYRSDSPGWSRALARGGTALTFAIAVGVVRRFDPSLDTMQLVERSTDSLLGLSYHLGVDSIDITFVLLLALVVLLVVVGVGPRPSRQSLMSLLAFEAVGMLALSTANLLVMALALLLLTVPSAALLHFEGAQADARARVRNYLIPTLFSVLLLLGVVVALGTVVHGSGNRFEFDAIARSGVPVGLQAMLLPALVLAVALRMPMVPFHGWFTGVIESSSATASVPLTVIPFGHYLFMRIGTELLGDAVGHHVVALSTFALGGMTYAVLTGLAQGKLRGALAYFQLALGGSLIVGAASFDPMGPTGGMLNALSLAIAGTGLLLVADFIHARLGTTDFAAVGGLVRTAPVLVGLFLVIGLADSGFPGTMGFVAEHTASHGAFAAHPFLAIAMLAVVNLASVLLWRAFIRSSLGPHPTDALRHFRDVLPRERAVLVAIAIIVIVVGLWLEPWIAIIEPTIAAHVLQP